MCGVCVSGWACVCEWVGMCVCGMCEWVGMCVCGMCEWVGMRV